MKFQRKLNFKVFDQVRVSTLAENFKSFDDRAEDLIGRSKFQRENF